MRNKGTARRTLIKRPLILLLALAITLLQAAMQAAPDARSIATGTWGGEHIILEVSEKGAEVDFDCAHGQVPQPITLDKNGDFDVAGTFTHEHGGPVRRDENPADVPARYSGHVDDHTMTLTVTFGKEKLGAFTLTHGSLTNLRKCR